MQAVILAAGKGLRLYPFTQSKPKPLIKILNKPILAHNLDQLIGIVEEVIIVVNYLKDKIKNYFGNEYKGIKLKYVFQKEMLGTGDAVLMTKNEIREKFIVMYGDDLYSRKDILRMIENDCSILLKHKEDVSAFGVVVLVDGIVRDIVEKPKKFVSSLVNTGLYIFEVDIFSYLEKIEKSERGEFELPDAIRLLIKQKEFRGCEVKGYWIPIGYPWNILEATKFLIKEKIVLGKNSKIEGDVEGFVVVGSNTIVKKGSKLKNVVIGDNCIIGKNCEIYESVIDDNVELLDNIKIDLVSDNFIKIKTPYGEFNSKRKELGAFIANNLKVKKNLNSGDIIFE